jgi:hypothetical protein
MTDIVERLRDMAKNVLFIYSDLANEAADEIERLRQHERARQKTVGIRAASERSGSAP